jgi:hypothetical protein
VAGGEGGGGEEGGGEEGDKERDVRGHVEWVVGTVEIGDEYFGGLI